MSHVPTGFSAPTSEQNDVSMQNISGSSGSINAHETDPKKHKFNMAELALLNASPALPALVATPLEVRSPVQIQVSSGSEISLISTAERQRRYDVARLKRELAESRVEEAQAKLDLSAGSKAGSIACLDDVRSEGGNSGRAQRTTDMGASLLQGRLPHTTSPATSADPFERLYTLEQTNIVPSTNTVASPLQGGLSLVGTSPLQGGLSQSTSPLQGGLPKSASPLQGGLPPTNTFTINQTVVNNDGCKFGTVSTSNQHETQIAVENVVRLAESHHHHQVVNMAESATQEHHQIMANLKA